MTNLDDFIGDAKRLGMTPAERAAMKKNLMNSMGKRDVRNAADVRQQMHMAHTIPTFITAAKNIKLTPSEHTSMRSALLTAVVNHDATVKSDTVHRSPFGWLSMIKGVPAMAAFLLLLGVGGGVSYAAEGAVPGDILYPVKIHVNENVMATLAVSAEAKARIGVRHAERRLREAENLALALRLNADNSSELKVAFLEQSTNVRRQISLLASTQDTALASDIGNEFQASLEAHQAVMQRLSDSSPERKELAVLIQDVRRAGLDTERTRVTAEIAMSTVPSDERHMSAERTVGSATKHLAQLRTFVERKHGRQEDSVKPSEIQQKLDLADSMLIEAQTKMDGGAYADGFGLLRRSLRNGQEARLLAEFDAEFAMNAGSTGASTVAEEEHTDDTMSLTATSAVAPTGEAMVGASADVAAPAVAKKQDDAVGVARKRLKATRALLDKRRDKLTAEAKSEAKLKLDTAGKTIDVAADFSAKGQSADADSYANAAISAIEYVETFIADTSVTVNASASAGAFASQNAASQPIQTSSVSSPSSDTAQIQLARPIFSPRYMAVREAIAELESILARSRGLLAQEPIDATAALVIEAQNTLVSAQAAFDAGNDAEAEALFDKTLAQAKEGTSILATAAQKAIVDIDLTQ